MPEWNSTAHDIFLDASEIIDPDARERFVREKCQNDEELLREVRELLASFNPAAEYFGKATGAMHSLVETSHCNSLRASRGDQIGRYKLLQVIGEGGFGVVYMAEQEVPVRRQVALKVIKPGMDTREVIARFEAERQALAVLEHDSIAKVLDAGETHDGRPFFVMELVRGVPITEFCDKNNLSTKERLELFVLVCSAVQHAHQKGIIHRDLKPANVMVTLNDGEPVPKVIDFGIAKATAQRLTEKTLFTRYGQMVGTPQYMSPEQAEMSGIDIDTRSDVYSLGALLYELLTGSPLIEIERIRDVGFKEMLRVIQEEVTPKPSQRLSSRGDELSLIARKRKSEPGPLCRMIRGELDWIVMRSIEKDRRRRYDTVSAFAADVRRYLAGEAVEAAAPTALYRFRKLLSRNRGLVTAGALIVTILMGATFFSLRQARIAWTAQGASEVARTNEETQRKEAERFSTELQRVSKEQRMMLYASDMFRAGRYLREGNLQHVRRILDPYRNPDPELGDLRSFEWKYLWSKSTSEALASFPADGKEVVASADGRFVAHPHKEKTIVRNQQPPWNQLQAIDLRTVSLSFSPDGELLAMGGNKSVTIYRTHNRDVAKEFLGASYPAKFSPDGKWLVFRRTTGGPKAKVGKLSVVRTGTWEEFGDHVPMTYLSLTWWRARNQIDFSYDGKFLLFLAPQDVLATRDVIIPLEWRFLRLDDRQVDVFPKFLPPGMAMSMSPNGKHVAINDPIADPAKVQIWDIEKKVKIASLNHLSVVNCVQYSPSGEFLATAGFDRMIRVYRTADEYKLVDRLPGSDGEINALTFAADNRTLFSSAFGDGGRKMSAWQFNSSTDPRPIVGSSIPIGYTDDGALVTVEGRRVRGWRDGQVLYEFEVSGDITLSELMAPAARVEGSRVAVGLVNGRVENWDLKTSQLKAHVHAESVPVTCVALHPTNPSIVAFGNSVIAGDRTSGGAWVANMQTGAEPQHVATGPLEEVLFSNDGKQLAVNFGDNSGSDVQVMVFDFEPHGLHVSKSARLSFPERSNVMSFSADGRYFATTGGDVGDTLVVFDRESWNEVARMKGNFGSFGTVSFSADCKTIAACSPSGAKLWHVPSWAETLNIEPPGPLATLMFHPDDPDRLTLRSSVHRIIDDIRVPKLREIDAESKN